MAYFPYFAFYLIKSLQVLEIWGFFFVIYILRAESCQDLLHPVSNPLALDFIE